VSEYVFHIHICITPSLSPHPILRYALCVRHIQILCVSVSVCIVCVVCETLCVGLSVCQCDKMTDWHCHTDRLTHSVWDTIHSRHTDTHTQTHRHTDTQTRWHTDTLTHWHTDNQTYWHTDTLTQTHRHTDILTHWHTDTLTHRHTYTQTHWHTVSEICLTHKYVLHPLYCSARLVAAHLWFTEKKIYVCGRVFYTRTHTHTCVHIHVCILSCIHAYILHTHNYLTSLCDTHLWLPRK